MTRETNNDGPLHNHNHGDDDDDECPICLGEENGAMARGPCHHSFCLPCLERVLSAPDTRHRSAHESLIPLEDAHLGAPTLGRCPICRSELSLFDLTKEDSDVPIVCKNHDLARSDLKGRVFVQNRSRVGNQSLHFPTEDDDSAALPYVDFSKNEDWRLEDGSRLPPQKYFEPGCHFHEPTRTFHGTLKWSYGDCSQRFRGSQEWDYLLAFSSDYRFIARGVLIKKRMICHNPRCTRVDCKFPLDGQWKVTWPDSSSRSSATFQVHGNRFVESAVLPFEDHRPRPLDFSDPEHPVIVWDQAGTRQSATLFDLHKTPVKVGESIEWEALSSTHPRMVWTHETLTPERAPLQVLHFGPDHSAKLYYHCLLTGTYSGHSVPDFHAETVWGNTFCQAFMVGLASYHFLSDQSGAYISYEHEQTALWPPLDNGSPVPAIIWFTETSFDAETRTFRGKMDWERTHHTTWQGCRWWRYVIDNKDTQDDFG
jgi:hypothetical protein